MYDQLDSVLKSRDITLPTKVYIVKAMILSSSHVWMSDLDPNEGWALKNWCFWTVVLEKTPLDCKEIKTVNSKGNQTWIFIGRTDAETPTLWSPDVKNWLIRKDPDDGKDLGQEETGTTEVGWHHQLNRHQFKQAVGDGEEPGCLAWCSPWATKSQTWLSDSTTRRRTWIPLWTRYQHSPRLKCRAKSKYASASLLCFTDITFFSYRLKVCDHRVMSLSTIFPTAFPHIVSQCDILVILTIVWNLPLAKRL